MLESIYQTTRLHNPESVTVGYSRIAHTSLCTALYYGYLFCQFTSLEFRQKAYGWGFRSCGMWRCVVRQWVPPTVSRKNSSTGTAPNQTPILLNYTTVKTSNFALWTSIRKFTKFYIRHHCLHLLSCFVAFQMWRTWRLEIVKAVRRSMALVILPCDLPWWPTVQRHLTQLSMARNSKDLIDIMQKIHNICKWGS